MEAWSGCTSVTPVVVVKTSGDTDGFEVVSMGVVSAGVVVSIGAVYCSLG
jgi:hypothetical protein